MAHSYRHTPIFGNTTARSEKEDKRTANRTERSRVRQMIHSCDDFEALVLPHKREVSDVWGFAKDGKHWLGDWAHDNDDWRRARLVKYMRK